MTSTTNILVVGAGPVGLVAACELARRDVAVRIIDKRPEPTDESRAILVHARSLGHVVLEAGEAYGFAGGGIAVVRPDGYIGLLAEAGDTAAVDAYFASLSAR